MKNQANYLWRSIEVNALKRLIKDIPIYAPIYDLGCGYEQIAKKVFPNHEIIGVDLKYNPDIKADICHLPLKDNSVNTVFCNSVLEHMKNMGEALAEIKRILKPQGILIFTVPTNKEIGLAKIRNHWLGHYNCFDIITWYAILQNLGFSIGNIEYYLDSHNVLRWDLLAMYQKIFRVPIVPKKTIDRWIDGDSSSKHCSAIAILAVKNV